MGDVHTVAAIELKKQDNTFGIVTSKRPYYVKASSASECQEWIRALNEIKTQLSHRNSISNDHQGLQMTQAGPSSPSRARPSQATPSDHTSAQASATRAANAAAAATPTTSGQPISINIPGKGNYVAPAQPRAIPNSGDAFSPLTATTDSDTGAEQYGMSYASSAGQSFGSSPGRDVPQHLSDQSGDGSRAGSSRLPRDARGGSGGSRGGRESSGGGESGIALGSSYQSGSAAGNTGGVLSSSDDDDDEDNEQLDQAMPLPSLSSPIPAGAPLSATTSTSTESSATPVVPAATQQAQQQRQLLQDPNRILHQGYLMKQSSRRKQWRKRWFVLTASNLNYSRSHMDHKAHREIALTSILDAIEHTAVSKHAQSSSPTSPGGSGGAFNFNSIGNALEGARGGGSGDASNAEETNKPERRQSVVAAAAGVASNLVAGVGASNGQGSSAGGNGASSQGPGINAEGPRKKTENCFKVITPKRTFLLCAPSEEEEIKWLSALQALLTRTRGAASSSAATSTTAATSRPANAGPANAGAPPVASSSVASTGQQSSVPTTAPMTRGSYTSSVAGPPQPSYGLSASPARG